MVITDWLDEIAEATGNIDSGVDRCSVDALELPISQVLSGERVVPYDMWKGSAIGVGWKTNPEATLVGDDADRSGEI